MDDISELQEKAASDESEIASLRAQIDRECIERLELRNKVSILSSGGRAEGTDCWLEGTSGRMKGMSDRSRAQAGLEVRAVSPRGRTIGLGAPAASLRGHRDGQRVKMLGVGGISRVHSYSFFL